MGLTAFLEDIDRRDWNRDASGTVRFAMIGTGWWTRERAIPALKASDRGQVTVLVSGRPDAATREVAAPVTRAMTYSQFHDGVGIDAYDAVYIATPNALHLPHVEAAAAHGKHILCEKPMEASPERAAAMIRAVADSDVRLMVGYRMQTEPLVRRAREIIRDGLLGDPVLVHSHMCQRLFEINPDHDQWRLDPDLVGPGTSVTDLGIYPINTARFVLADDPVSVSAAMRSPSPGFERVPDEGASFEVRFDGGTLAACSASQNAHRSGRFEVVGTEGRLVIEPAFFDDDARSLVVEREGASVQVASPPVDQMTEEFEYFSDRVLAGGSIAPDGTHGLVDVRTIAAIYRAAAEGRQVSL